MRFGDRDEISVASRKSRVCTGQNIGGGAAAAVACLLRIRESTFCAPRLLHSKREREGGGKQGAHNPCKDEA